MRWGGFPNGLRHNPNAGGPPYQVGCGLDDRSRFDVFVSEPRIETFEGGRRISKDRLATPILFAAAARVYFPHYLYHTGNEVSDLITYRPYEQFWIDDVPYSDEQHCNNVGYEVLPASTDWSTLAARLR